METDVSTAYCVTPICSIPNGTFKGLWSGYNVKFDVDGQTYVCDTINGVRGWNVPCSVIVSDNSIKIVT